MDSRPRAQDKIITAVIFLLGLVLFLGMGVNTSAWAEDRLKLDSTAIKGSRELPKVLYIVPWKSARLGDLAKDVGGSSFDTEWKALDRDVFRRQVEYYGMLYEDEGKSTK